MTKYPTNSAIQLLDGDFYIDEPHLHYQWMRDNAPVFWDETYQLWAVSRHQDVMDLSKNTTVFCSRHGSRPTSPPNASMINMDDPEHRKRRRLVADQFSNRIVRSYEENIRRICRELIHKVADKGQCDFVDDIAAPLPMIIIGDMLGVKPEDRDLLLRWSDDMLSNSNATASEQEASLTFTAMEAYTKYILNVIGERKLNPLITDLIGLLVHAEIDGQSLDEEDLIQESLLILIGGDETTRHAITGGMTALLEHPKQLQSLIDEPQKIRAATEEILRWTTPIKNMNRTATENFTLHGETIAQGDRVLLMYEAANFDERAFDNPEQFNINREFKSRDHVAFGGNGPHFCLGAFLARVEIRVMLEELLTSIPDIRLNDKAKPPRRPNNFISGITKMPVSFTAKSISL